MHGYMVLFVIDGFVCDVNNVCDVCVCVCWCVCVYVDQPCMMVIKASDVM
jgi:hypothetical protein